MLERLGQGFSWHIIRASTVMMGKILMTQGVVVVDCAVANVAAYCSPVSRFA